MISKTLVVLFIISLGLLVYGEWKVFEKHGLVNGLLFNLPFIIGIGGSVFFVFDINFFTKSEVENK